MTKLNRQKVQRLLKFFDGRYQIRIGGTVAEKIQISEAVGKSNNQVVYLEWRENNVSSTVKITEEGLANAKLHESAIELEDHEGDLLNLEFSSSQAAVTMHQFNCVVGDTVLLATRTGAEGRWRTEQLAVVETGILNEAGCPLDFMAVNAKGRRIQLSPFTEADDCRVIIIPPASKLPKAAKRLLRKHPKYKASLIVARKPGCSEYSFQVLSSKSLKPMTLVQTEVSIHGISLTEDGWYLGREEIIRGRQILQAGHVKLPAQLLPGDVISA